MTFTRALARCARLLLAGAALLACPANAQTVPVDGGIVAGEVWNGSTVFRGIPFVAPRLGDLRWKPPQPVPYWHGVRASLKHPASCLQIAADIIFRCPAINVAAIMAAKGAPVWHYEFDAAPGGGKTSHAAEIAYAFGDRSFGQGSSLKTYWLNFIRRGDPNDGSLPDWPRLRSGQPAHLLFNDQGVTPRGALRPEICSLDERI